MKNLLDSMKERRSIRKYKKDVMVPVGSIVRRKSLKMIWVRKF